MDGEGGGEEAGCLGVGRVFVHTRGDRAAVNLEVDTEGGGLDNQESNFALGSGIEGSAAESALALWRDLMVLRARVARTPIIGLGTLKL